jgi:hypothetical protein
MLNYTCLAASSFTDSATKRAYIRVYYQNREQDILESCYDSENGWQTRSDQLVASGTIVAERSPIAVASWNTGREVCYIAFPSIFQSRLTKFFRHESSSLT